MKGLPQLCTIHACETQAPLQMIVMAILTTRRHSTAFCIMRHSTALCILRYLKAEGAFKIALGLLAR